MADKRAFAMFDVGYLDNPKIMDVFDASPIAICMHFASVLYCAQHLTDGVVALRTMQRRIGGTDADSALLVDAGLWHLPGHGCQTCPEPPAGKAYVHDYLQHNRTSDGVKDKSAAGKIGAAARWDREKAKREADANRMRTALPDALPTAMQHPMPREIERKKEKDLSSTLDEFARWYSTYPRKEAKEAAKKAFIKARKSASLDELITGVARYVKANQGQERRFWAMPASWLNARRWDDELPQQNVVNGPWSKEFHA